ncbi:hypothetical protein Tco_0395362 [Tanacetum coccineum]
MVTTRRNSNDDVPNFEAMISAAVANALPNLTAALRTDMKRIFKKRSKKKAKDKQIQAWSGKGKIICV